MAKATYLEITAAILAGGTSPITLGTIVVAGFAYEKYIDGLTDQVKNENNYNEFQANAFGHAYAAAEIGFYLGHNTSKILEILENTNRLLNANRARQEPHMIIIKICTTMKLEDKLAPMPKQII